MQAARKCGNKLFLERFSYVFQTLNESNGKRVKDRPIFNHLRDKRGFELEIDQSGTCAVLTQDPEKAL